MNWWKERARKGSEKFIEEEWRAYLYLAIGLISAVILDSVF